ETKDYLDRLTHRIDDLKQRVADEAQQAGACDRNPWRRTLPPDVDDHPIADLAIWRAAHDIPPTEPRPTGPPAKEPDAARHQSRLTRRLSAPPPISIRSRADADSNRLRASQRQAQRHGLHQGASREVSGPSR